MFKKGTKMYSIVGMKCPRCQETNMFRTPLLPQFKIYDMHENCAHCGLKYEIEPGFWWGAMYMGYAFSAGALLIISGIYLLLFKMNMPVFLTILGISALIGFAYNARLARTSFINLWVRYDTQYSKNNMKIEQIYTGCLAQGAYYITSNGEAAIIDPLRETQPYINRLERDGVSLKYIFETHFHADFVSGHVDLSKKTNAPIVYGPNAACEFDCISATDGQIFELGKVKIKVLHTPGHTMESTCFLLIDENGKENALFSGDTLFIGDVGRPDLAQKAANMTQEQLAATLFHSLRNKVMTLPDEVIVYPAHGAGSACGKNMSKETVSTIGNQKQFNYALRADMTEAEFVQEVTDGLLPPPMYFGGNVAMNKKGYDSFENVFNNGMRGLSVAEFEVVAEETGALILDTRDSAEFWKGFVPQSINIGINGDFAPWVGALVGDVAQAIILITEQGQEAETVTRLTRVGFDNLVGHLKGGFEAWEAAGKDTDSLHRIPATQFAAEVKIGESKVIDVRKATEYAAEHVAEAYSRPLADINNWIKDINPAEHFYLHCAGGYRSMIAASMLQARGYRNFTEVEGGFKAIEATGVPKTNFVCQSKISKA